MGNGGIKIEMTIDEVNFILSTLSEKPYKDVSRLIMKIQQQGNEQVREPFYKGLPGQDENPV